MGKKPSQSEDEYFARESALKLQKLHQEKLKQENKAEREERKALHFMKCSKCGWDLETVRWRDVEIEKCFHCGAIVLDDGELEKLAGKEQRGSWLHDVFTLFKGSEEKR